MYTLWFLAGVPRDKIKNEDETQVPWQKTKYIEISEGRALFENLKLGRSHAHKHVMVCI